MKKEVPVKTLYYKDELNDDFSATNESIDKKVIDEKFNYFRLDNFFIRLWSNFLYFIIVKPLIFLALKIYSHYKVVNRKVMKKRGKNGCFIYGNHTNYLPDAAFNSLLHAGRNYVVTGSETVNIKGIVGLVQDLGAIPLGDTLEARKHFLESLEKKLKKNASITIYPEAHIWPYYTKVRPFKKDSFTYPYEFNVPVYSVATCYQKRRFGIRPRIVHVVDGPFYPDKSLPRSKAIQLLRDQVHDSLVNATNKYSTYEYFHYEKKED